MLYYKRDKYIGYDMLRYICIILSLNLGLVGSEYFYYHHDERVKLTPKKMESHSRWLMKSSNGRDVILTNKIIVKTDDKNLLDRYLQEYNASILKELKENVFLVIVQDVNQTLDITNMLHNKEGIIYVYPDLIRKRVLR